MENILIQIIWLLFTGLVSVTIIAFALIIADSYYYEQIKNTPQYALPSYVVFNIFIW